MQYYYLLRECLWPLYARAKLLNIIIIYHRIFNYNIISTTPIIQLVFFKLYIGSLVVYTTRATLIVQTRIFIYLYKSFRCNCCSSFVLCPLFRLIIYLPYCSKKTHRKLGLAWQTCALHIKVPYCFYGKTWTELLLLQLQEREVENDSKMRRRNWERNREDNYNTAVYIYI